MLNRAKVSNNHNLIQKKNRRVQSKLKKINKSKQRKKEKEKKEEDRKDKKIKNRVNTIMKMVSAEITCS